MSEKVSPTTYGLLGLLAIRSWTGYELTTQLHRSLRFVWSSSEGHIYREQKKLVDLGWASVVKERVGKRHRNRYQITPAGREALKKWLETEPEEPHFDIEGVLRVFFADLGTVDDLVSALEATASSSRIMLDELLENVDEYLSEGGPVWMLERGIGGAGSQRLDFRGRPMFPERLHVVALVIDITTSLLARLESFCMEVAAEVGGWTGPTDPSLTSSTRARLERIRVRHSRSPRPGLDKYSQ